MLNNLDDVLLTLSFRRHGDCIVLNSKSASGNWGTELRNHLAGPRAFGPNLTSATIAIKDVGSAYQIFTNGNYLATYNKRIGGDAEKIEYAIGEQQDSMFPNPITVTMQ